MEYTVFEYNKQTRQYTPLASVSAASAGEAKNKYAKQAQWSAKSDTVLFAKLPLCR